MKFCVKYQYQQLCVENIALLSAIIFCAVEAIEMNVGSRGQFQRFFFIMNPNAIHFQFSPSLTLPYWHFTSFLWHAIRRVARNSQRGGCLGGLRAEPPAARGQWGVGAKPPAAGGTGVWGHSPQRSKILHFFAKITSFYRYFDYEVMLLKRGLEIGSANKIKLMA